MRRHQSAARGAGPYLFGPGGGFTLDPPLGGLGGADCVGATCPPWGFGLYPLFVEGWGALATAGL